MGNWIKSEEIIKKEDLEKVKEAFNKNKVVSAYLTSKRMYIRYKPLRNQKIFNITPEILDDFINLFINLKVEKSFSTDDLSMLISYSNKNTVLVLKSEDEKKIFFNCDKDLSQIGFED